MAIIQDGEIQLYGYRFRVTPDPITEELVSVFPGKIVIGDARRVDDPIASSYVMQDWTGGGLARWMNPETDFDRFWYADLCTWFTRQLTLLPLARTLVTPAFGDGNPHDVRAGTDLNGTMLVGFDQYLVSYDTNEAPTVVGSVTGVITKMYTWRVLLGANAGKQYAIICWNNAGVTGFHTYDGTTLALGTGTAVDVVMWDGKLVKVGDDNAVQYTTDLATWTAIPGQNVVTVPNGNVYGITVFPDMWGFDTLHFYTTDGVYWYDESGQVIRSTRFTLPRLLNQGKGSVIHRDSMYVVSPGVQVIQYNGSVVSPVGLDRDWGLPQGFRGTIGNLASTLNWLVAGVTSTATLRAAVNPVWPGDTISYGDVMLASIGFPSLYLQDKVGGGWHTLFLGKQSGTGMYWVGSSSSNNTYRLWFGNNGGLSVIDLYPDIHNPLDNPTQAFARDGQLTTPWNEMGWSEVVKCAIRQEFGVKQVNTNCTWAGTGGQAATPCQIQVEVALDYDENTWNPVTTITSNTPDPFTYGGKTGLAFKAIRFRYTLHRCDNTAHTPVLVWSTLSFIKEMPARWGYSMTLDLTGAYAGVEPEAMAETLRRMVDPADIGATLGTFTGFVKGRFVDRQVKVSELSGQLQEGTAQRGIYHVSLVAFT